MAKRAVKSRRLRRTWAACLGAGVIYSALALLDGRPLTPGRYFGGAYVQDDSLPVLVLIQLPVLMNLILLDGPMRRFHAGMVAVRYDKRRRWLKGFIAAAAGYAAMIYLVEFAVLAAAAMAQGKGMDGWSWSALTVLASNIAALVITCCHMTMAEAQLSRASCCFLLLVGSVVSCMLPDTGAMGILRLALPMSYFHFELASRPWGSGAALAGLTLHLALTAALMERYTRKTDLIR